MSTVRRSNLSLHPALESAKLYSETLRAYSTEELEDVYYHIDVLVEPFRYQLVQMELERRGLQPGPEDVAITLDRNWIDRAPGFAGHPAFRRLYLVLLLFLVTSTVMGAMLVPIWLFAGPFEITGVQASIVYVLLLLMSIPVGLSCGIKAGGLRARSLTAVVGVAFSLWIFYAIGGIDVIVQPLFKAGGVSGGMFTGW